MENETVEVAPEVQDKMERFMEAVAKEIVVAIVAVVVIQGVSILGKEIAARYKRRKMHIVPDVTVITDEK